MTKTEQIAYAAGLFDGEGYVAIELVPRARATAVMLIVSVQMTTPYGPQLLGELFGGTVDTSHPPSRAQKGWRPHYRWRATGARAAQVLRDLRPYLREKAAQADLCLEARAIQERRPKGQGAAYRPEDRARVTAIHAEVKALKRG